MIAHSPGDCPGWYSAVFSDDQCRRCHTIGNESTRRGKKTSPAAPNWPTMGVPAIPSALSRESAPAPVQTTPMAKKCIHLETVREWASPGCNKHVYGCAIHERCQTFPWDNRESLACCERCRDYDDGRPRTTEVIDLLAKSADTTLIRAVCINLDRRPDRWVHFKQACPLANVERWPGIDGKQVPRPKWWNAGAGAWGCRLAHLGIIESALADGWHQNNGVVVIFEDDCLFVPNFVAKTKRFIQSLPSDWQQVYFGGQHLGRNPPTRVNQEVYRPHMVNRAHAYAVRGPFIGDLHRHWCDLTAHAKWGRHHIDHRMQVLHASGKYNVYTPPEWIVGQSRGTSDIGPNMTSNYFWN